MIDLSNNNGTGHNFVRAHQAGHRRLYLKASESVGFTDPVFPLEGHHAHNAGFRVGVYHFAHGTHSPREELEHFAGTLHHLSWPLRLRPALDLEYGTPRAALGAWAAEWLSLCRRELGVDGIVYGSGGFLAACQFPRIPGGLWLASYSRNDGTEHPYLLPRPWKRLAAHQYTSNGLVPGIRGRCDVSKVTFPAAIDWPGR